MDTGSIARALSAFWADRKNRLAFLGPLGVVALFALLFILPVNAAVGFFLILLALGFLGLLWCLTRLVLEDW